MAVCRQNFGRVMFYLQVLSIRGSKKGKRLPMPLGYLYGTKTLIEMCMVMASFDEHSEEEKMRLLVREGKFLLTTPHSQGTVDIYALGNEFIEVVFTSFSEEIIHMRCVNESELQTYLARIKFSDLNDAQ